MIEDVKAHLDSNRIGVISIEMPDGSPHAATVHVAYQEKPFSFLILTGRTSRKAESLLEGKEVKASLVIGFNEELMRTLQLDGTAQFTENSEYMEAYFAKLPEKREKYTPPDSVFILFTPTWGRFSDYNSPGGKKIVSLEQF